MRERNSSSDRKRRWGRSGLMASCLLAICSTGCGSTPMPPKLSGPQLALLEEVDLPYRVAVEPYQYGLYSRLLLEDLRAADIFAGVDMLDDIHDADLLARVVHPVSNDYVAVIPLFSIFTFGIVPTWFPMEYGASFELVGMSDGSACAAQSVAIDASYEGTLVMGWVSSILNISPRRTVRDVRKTDRYRRSIAHAVAQRGDEIRRLVHREC